MARIDLTIPSLGNEQVPSGGSKFVDLRDSIPGDSYNWSWTRPLSQVKYLAIHHTAAPNTQTPEQIANFHVQSNGWGGIGYHFVISKNGTVYYVGDISTARANVANLNEQVIGICLVGNFTNVEPTPDQINSVRLLCDFFINNYPSLPNVNSWDSVRGHKELPGQATACPGNTWPNWKAKIISGESGPLPGGGGVPPISGNSDRGAQITELYRKVLGRDPDMGGLQTYTNGPLSITQIMEYMVYSSEHQNLIALAKESNSLMDQVENLQTSLGLVNEQLINLQQKLKEKDTTLTIFQALYNLYKFVFMPGKVT